MANIAVARNSAEVKLISKSELFIMGGYRLITTSTDASLECERTGIPYEEIEKYHSFDDIEKINEISDKLSKGWWKLPEVKKLCPELNSYCGITPGHATELAFYHVISEAIRSVITAQKLIEIKKPDSIIISGGQKILSGGFWVGFRLNLKADAIRLVAEKIGIPVSIIALADYHSVAERCINSGKNAIGMARRLVRFIFRKMHFAESGHGHSKGDRPCILIHAEGRHADDMWPLLKKLINEPELGVVFITQDMSQSCISLIRNAGGALFDPCIHKSDFFTQQIKTDFEVVRSQWEKLSNLQGLTTIGEQYIGMSVWPLVRFQFEWFFNHGLYELMERTQHSRKTMETLRPDLFLTPIAAGETSTCWTLTAQSMGIPCLTQLHGTLYLRPSKFTWAPEYSDKFAIWGPLTRDWYVQQTGRASEDFVCTGYPLFETYAEKYSGIDVEAVCERLALTCDKPIILFLVSMTSSGASAGYYKSQFGIYEAFFREMAKMPDAQIIVRTHQASDPRLPELYARRNNLQCLINPQADLLELLKIANVVVGQPTTAMLNTMIVKKPFLFFNIMVSKDMAWGFEHGVRFINEPSELVPVINSVLNNTSERSMILKNQNNYVEELAGPLDGQASQRIIRLIKQMIQERSLSNGAGSQVAYESK